jgi:hypothetical protein
VHNAAMATRLVFLVPGFFGFTSESVNESPGSVV